MCWKTISIQLVLLILWYFAVATTTQLAHHVCKVASASDTAIWWAQLQSSYSNGGMGPPCTTVTGNSIGSRGAATTVTECDIGSGSAASNSSWLWLAIALEMDALTANLANSIEWAELPHVSALESTGKGWQWQDDADAMTMTSWHHWCYYADAMTPMLNINNNSPSSKQAPFQYWCSSKWFISYLVLRYVFSSDSFC
jgi:hypothetical protein